MSAKKKILIVEDEKGLIKNLEMALEDKYEITAAMTGQEGLTKAKDDQPDLILLDITLPEMDGTEVLRALKSSDETSKIPVLVLTNLSDKATVRKILSSGGRDYMIKADWSIDDIIKKVNSYF